MTSSVCTNITICLYHVHDTEDELPVPIRFFCGVAAAAESGVELTTSHLGRQMDTQVDICRSSFHRDLTWPLILNKLETGPKTRNFRTLVVNS